MGEARQAVGGENGGGKGWRTGGAADAGDGERVREGDQRVIEEEVLSASARDE